MKIWIIAQLVIWMYRICQIKKIHALLWQLQNNKLHGCKKIDQIKLEDDVVDDYEDDKAVDYEDDKSNDEFRKDNINTTFKNIYHDLEKLRIGLLENDIEQNDDQDEGKSLISYSLPIDWSEEKIRKLIIDRLLNYD